MKINEIIKNKRTILGLTQEALANALGVSTPAVNKWEKGISYPDITLLSPLARLLKTDLNELLCFSENLTEKEMSDIINEISTLCDTNDYAKIYNKGMEYIHQYPTCDLLILNIASVLNGALHLCEESESEKYKKEIYAIYKKCLTSGDEDVRNQAKMLNTYLEIEKGNYDYAQEILDSYKETMFDKKTVQALVYVSSGKLEQAKIAYERLLMNHACDINNNLICLAGIAVKENRFEDAKYLMEVSKKNIELFDLWDYTYDGNMFGYYTSIKNKKGTIETIKNMLKHIQKPWKYFESKLYSHIPKKECEEDFSFYNFIVEMLKNVKDDDDLAFVRDDPEFIELVSNL